MEKLVVTALEEIATEGPQGCEISKLWTLIQFNPSVVALHLYVLEDDRCKQEIWQSLLRVSGLRIQVNGEVCDPASIMDVQNAQKLAVVIIASQELRDGCLGLYDIRHADTQPSLIQHAILERLATARTKGVTQNELGKEFKVEGNKLFYILRSLESRGLIVRKSTLLRNHKSGVIVTTNLVHLTRYATYLTLNPHQRFEISNSGVEDPGDGGGGEKQLMINDDVPAMKAVCDKLQQAEGKTLVVSDMKLSLGYRLAAGHRAWRRLVKKLEDGGYVTALKAKVGRKEKPCLQLLKPFNENEQTNEADPELKGPKRGQVTEQLADLSVDQQIYNMIDDGGADGMTMMEVWKRIGLNNKRNYYRIQNMTLKHGLLFEAENHKRSTIYRLKTPHSRRPPAADDHDMELEGGADTLFKVEVEEGAIVATLQNGPDAGNSSFGAETSAPAAAAAFPPPSLFRKGQAYPCLTVTTTSIQREKHVLARLQEEKFLVRAELHRWLESMNTQKTVMDRKTLIRTLAKLQSEGKCKCLTLEIPGTTNCGRKRKADVVLLPSLEMNFDLLSAVHERIRKFEIESRVQSREKALASSSGVVVTGVKRMKIEKAVETDPDVKTVQLQDNGYIPSKMVRVRMLHHFLWSYTNTQEIGNGYRIFGLMDALQTMPLELFLQIAGSKNVIHNLAELCRQGTRLCNLPQMEQAALLDAGAGGRLAWLVDILRRLKLIRYAVDYGHGPVALQATGQLGNMVLTEATLTYALDENLYIEEPPPAPLQSLANVTGDATFPKYHFNINTKQGLDEYWEYLEYFFSGAQSTVARVAFPGSNVPEIFGLRSWTSLRIMTVDQRNKLYKRVDAVKRMSVKECAEVAKELNLTLEQVLRCSYEKNRKVRLQSLKDNREPSFMETFTNTTIAPSMVEKQASRDSLNQAIAVTEEEVSAEEGDDHENHISVVTKLKPTRSRKFPWTDALERSLFFAYARHRALLGVNINRVDWKAVQLLPAPRDVCRRRITLLRAEPTIKKAIINLCTLVAARYQKYCNLEDQEAISPEFDPNGCDMTGFKTAVSQDIHWDDPNHHDVVAAVEEVIRCRALARSKSNKRNSVANNAILAENISTSPMSLDSSQTTDSSQPASLDSSKLGKRKRKPAKRRDRKKAKTRPTSSQILTVEETVHSSVGAANAVEFIKLVFLNSSVFDTSVQLPKSFMDGLHQFKESDVFAAFNFLKERKMVASGEGAQSFVLSDEFNQKVSNCRLPGSTDDEYMAFRDWLQVHKEELQHGYIPYDKEDHYGQLLHLFSRVSVGELTLEPKLPEEGIGEAEDPRSIGCSLKRKYDIDERDHVTYKTRVEGPGREEIFQAARRERGFPGIESLVRLQTFSLADMLSEGVSIETESSSMDSEASNVFAEETQSSDAIAPEILDRVLRAVESGGDEGLKMKEIALFLGLTEKPWDVAKAEQYVNALEFKNAVKKVNAFDHVRVIAQSRASHYFLQFTNSRDNNAMEIDGMENGPSTLPILPWLTDTGETNTKFLDDLVRRVLSIVRLSPGIPEDLLVKEMDMLNPQTVCELLKMLCLDGKLVVRSVTHSPVAPPTLLKALIKAEGSHTKRNYYYPATIHSIHV